MANTLSDDYRYSSWYGSTKVLEGTAVLDKDGQAVIELDTKMAFNSGKSQIFSIEATIADGSQNPSFSRKNIIVYAGEYGIYRQDAAYCTKVNTSLSLPLSLVSYRRNTSLSGISLTAHLKRETWISYQEENNKYPSYRKQEEEIPSLQTKTDGHGKAFLTFTPTITGSYTLTVEGKDDRGNLISKSFYSYVSDYDYPLYSAEGKNDLIIATDKQKYNPTDTAHIMINSTIPNRDVLLTLERGKVNRYQIVHLDGKNTSVDIPLFPTDVPNMFVNIASFSDIY